MVHAAPPRLPRQSGWKATLLSRRICSNLNIATKILTAKSTVSGSRAEFVPIRWKRRGSSDLTSHSLRRASARVLTLEPFNRQRGCQHRNQHGKYCDSGPRHYTDLIKFCPFMAPPIRNTANQHQQCRRRGQSCPKMVLPIHQGKAAHSEMLAVILFTKSGFGDCAAVFMHGNLLPNFRNFIEIQINKSQPRRTSHIKNDLSPRIDHK